MGWLIVAHSFRLLFRNLGEALKISVGPYLIAIVGAALILALAGLPFDFLIRQGTEGLQAVAESGPMILIAALACVVLLFFVSSWVAVAWHRFVLLEEYPGLLPAVAGRPIWPYLGKVLLLSILLIIIAIPVSMVIGFVLIAPFQNASDTTILIAGFVAGILIGTILTVLSLRFGLALPAMAVGRPMGFGESWRLTKPLNGAIIGAVVILIVLNAVATAILAGLFQGGIIGSILELVVNWISLMVGISILTTLYGHAVEGRSID